MGEVSGAVAQTKMRAISWKLTSSLRRSQSRVVRVELRLAIAAIVGGAGAYSFCDLTYLGRLPAAGVLSTVYTTC